MSLAELSRTVAFRLTLLYSLIFTVCVIVLLGFVYWQTATEMTRRVDQILTLENTRLTAVKQNRLLDEIDKSIQRDLRHIYYYGLFTPDGNRVAGNIAELPKGMAADGQISESALLATDTHIQALPTRVLSIRLSSGEILLIGHDVQQLIEFGDIMRRAFFWGGSLTILTGLMIGLALGFRPLRRVEQIRQVCELIMRGDFSNRLPVSRHRDELDMLAAIVNRMLSEIERLMLEVKGAGENIAHDLRTPLTRLRAVLYRTQQSLQNMPEQCSMVEQAITEVDALLQRFRALLRISEIENNRRLSNFKMLQPENILEQAVGFFAPLAEDKGIHLRLTVVETASIYADGELLFEAVNNLLDNALKFTPAGGQVEARLSLENKKVRIDIIDSGAGIAESERTAVLNRFYRGGGDTHTPGYGLGLSVVMAVIRLHNFKFELTDAHPGSRATIFC